MPVLHLAFRCLAYAMLLAALVHPTMAIAAEAEPNASANVVEDLLDVAPVWSGHPVGFALLTHQGRQFVAFYDDQRRLTVASRLIAQRQWHFVRLPVVTGWDSHNYIA